MKKLQIIELSDDSARLFLSLISEIYRPVIQNLALYPHHIALGAYVEEQPVGLIFGFLDKKERIASVVSLMTKLEFRRRGIGTRLANRFTEIMAGRGAIELMIETWDEEVSLDNTNQGFLESTGWSHGDPLGYLYQINASNAAEILGRSWARKRLPKQLQLVPWTQLSQKQLAHIKKIERVQNVNDPQYLSPFLEEVPEPFSSLSIWKSDKILGWGINVSPYRGLVVFKRWYVLPEFRACGSGIFLTMLSGSIARTSDPSSGIRFGSFVVDAPNIGMIRLADRLFPGIEILKNRKLRWFRPITN